MRTGRGASRVGGGARRPRRRGSACSCRVPAQSCRTLHAPRTAVHQASPYLELAQDRAEAWAQTQLQCEHAYNCIRALHGGLPPNRTEGHAGLADCTPRSCGLQNISIHQDPAMLQRRATTAHPQPPVAPPLDRAGGCSQEAMGLPHHPFSHLPCPGQSGGLLTGVHGAPPSPPPPVSPPLEGAGGCSQEAMGLLHHPLPHLPCPGQSGGLIT